MAEAPVDADGSRDEPLLGVLDPAWRILLPPVSQDRRFWGALALVTLLYLAAFVSLLPALDHAVTEEARRRGQVDDPKSVSVEIVEDPDKAANARHDQSGSEQPAPVPPQPAQPPQQQPRQAEETPQLRPTQQPETAEEQQPKETTPAETPAQSQEQPSTETTAEKLGIDVTMNRYVAALDAEMERRKQQRAARPSPPAPAVSATLSGTSRLRGQAASGQNDAYSRSVIAALIRSKPPPFALRGEVLVSFLIGPGGAVVFVHILHSSGNKAMDAEAVAAIRRAGFDPPPAGKTERDLTYIIHYVFN